MIYKNRIPYYRGPGVYVIVNLVNGKMYVGSSFSVYGRLCGHRKALRKGIHDNSHLQKAWDKYGEYRFRFYLVEACEPDQCIELEQYYIDHFDTTDRDKGYNICLIAGGPPMTGRNHSEESKAKMSAKRKGVIPVAATKASAELSRGIPRSAEVRAKISAGNKGKVRTIETVNNIKANHWSKRSDAAEIAQKSASKNRGRKHSLERRAKISEGNKRKWQKYREELKQRGINTRLIKQELLDK